MSENGNQPVTCEPPKRGDIIYVTPMSFCRGFVDHTGGQATVVDVTIREYGGEKIVGVAVDVAPNTHFDWAELGVIQAELKQQFGALQAQAGPILLSA